MANWANLKVAIASVIKKNGNQEITGQLLQNTLLNIVDTIGAGATLAGIATPNTNPGNIDGPIFYIAVEPGKYINFNNIIINTNEIVILYNKNSVWLKYLIADTTIVASKIADNSIGIEKLENSLIDIIKNAYNIAEIEENSFCVIDTDKNIVLQYSQEEGLDVAKISEHFISLLGLFIQQIEVYQDGIYLIDNEYNIGACINKEGLHAINLVEYKFFN